MPRPNFEQVEHYAKQWSNRLQRAVSKRFDKKAPEDSTQDELLGFYHAATSLFVMSITFAFLLPEAIEDETERQAISDSIARDLRKAVDNWMRTMPKELRAVRFPGENSNV